MICFKKIKAIILFLSIMWIVVFGSFIVDGDFNITQVSIDPINQSVYTGETFNVNIYCVPNQPIKSFEFALSFNATLLRANYVSEGTIFNGYTTFFNNGSINNIDGTINYIYNLIIGIENVSESGTLVTISFTALDTIGVSYLNLIDVGVTNDTQYIDVNVLNGSVSIEADYSLTVNIVGGGSVTKNPDKTIYNNNEIVTLNANANIGWTFDHWSGDLNGNTTIIFITMNSNKEVTATFINSIAPDINNINKSNPPYNPPSSNQGGDIITNNPPLNPINISGPASIKTSVEYVYTIYTTDPESDSIRYRVDWGDGFVSDWSGFVDSGSSVLFTHSWNLSGIYSLQIIAEDIYYLNTSWNYVFDVVVSNIENKTDFVPIVFFNISDDYFTNNTVFFNASTSFDDDVIVSYFWDFGDGASVVGKNVTHVYIKPGTYIITLVVTDNSGNINTKTMTRIIKGYNTVIETKEGKMFYLFNFLYVYIGIIVMILVCLCVIFRSRIYLFVLNHQINSMSHSLQNRINRINKIK